MDRKLRMGMIGGGNGAFIGAIHRAAALMDNQIELVCGCFSSRPDVSLASGREYFLSDERIYASFREMIEREAALPEGVRMDFVSIVTPNFLHFEPAMAALDRGFDVVLDKPMTYSLDEAYRLREKIRETGRTLALTHTYSGYPAVKEARERVASGVFGKIRKIYVAIIPQGWLSDRAELQPGSNAGWRTDPARARKGGLHGRHRHACASVGGICFRTALREPVRRSVGHCRGSLAGRRRSGPAPLRRRCKRRTDRHTGGCRRRKRHFDPPIRRTKAAWNGIRQSPIRCTSNGPTARWKSCARATAIWVLPRGPIPARRAVAPKGYIEAFANIYRNFARTVRARREGREPQPEWTDFPSVEDGIRGMQFIETMVRSGSDPDRKWTDWVG